MRNSIGPLNQASHAGLRLVAALGFFWVHRGYALAGDDRTRRAIEADPDAPAGLRARALQACGPSCPTPSRSWAG